MIVQRIGVLSGAKIFGAVYAGMGLIFGAIFSLVGLVQMMIPMGGSDLGGMFGLWFGVGAIVILPILYGAGGFIFGAIGTFIYNLVAAVVGGLELTLAEKPVVSAMGVGQPPAAPYAG